MRITSRTFELTRTSNGVYAIFRRPASALTLVIINQEELDELFRLLGPIQEGQQVVWLRDVDGTGSLHPCAPDDPGALMFVGPPR